MYMHVREFASARGSMSCNCGQECEHHPRTHLCAAQSTTISMTCSLAGTPRHGHGIVHLLRLCSYLRLLTTTRKCTQACEDHKGGYSRTSVVYAHSCTHRKCTRHSVSARVNRLEKAPQSFLVHMTVDV